MFKFLRHLFRREPAVSIVVPSAYTLPLDVRERAELRDWLDLPITRKALALVEATHPGLHTSGIAPSARSEWDQLAAVNFLNRIRGWESYRKALLSLGYPTVSRSQPTETYPSQ